MLLADGLSRFALFTVKIGFRRLPSARPALVADRELVELFGMSPGQRSDHGTVDAGLRRVGRGGGLVGPARSVGGTQRGGGGRGRSCGSAATPSGVGSAHGGTPLATVPTTGG